MTERIRISKIERPLETQPRTTLDKSIVDEYAMDMKKGAKFPPVDIFKIGRRYILVDGFHRLAAAVKASRDEFPCVVHKGTMRDAVLFASGVNATHGSRRTLEDKRHSVARVLADQEWSKWNDSRIAEICHVSRLFVSKVRKQVSCNVDKIDPERKVKRGSKTYAMKTGRIGKNKKSQTSASERPATPAADSSDRIITVADTAAVPAGPQAELPSVQQQEPEVLDHEQPPATLPQKPAEQMIGGLTTLPALEVFSPDICKSGSCPDGTSHYAMNQRRKRMECDLAGVEITQLKDCPIRVRQRKTAAATSTITTEPVEHLDTKPADLEMPPSPPTTLPDPQPLSSPTTEAPEEQFIATGLSPERTSVLDAIIEAGNAKTHLEAIEFLIDSAKAELGTVTDTAVPPYNQLQVRQEDKGSDFLKSDKPWMFPTRQLSQEEWNEFFTGLVHVACTPNQKEMIKSVITNRKFPSEIAVVDYALNLVSNLEKFAEDLDISKEQPFTPGKILQYRLNREWFAPLFPITSLNSTNYLGPTREVLVLSVFVEFVYYLKPGRLP